MKKSKLFTTLLFLLVLSLNAKTPYVILVSFDGFRWDYVNRNITPNIQKVIDEGTHALSLRPSFPSKTFPNHISIITGMYPEHHGIISNGFKNLKTGDTYRFENDYSQRESKWYLGEAFWETAEQNGIRTASHFWPGSTLNDETRRPTYFKYYDHYKPYKERIDTLVKWLQLQEEKRPHFLTVYFDETDTKGHIFGPNSPEINKSIRKCDSLIEYLNIGLENIGMRDSVNVIIVSDHGMTETSKDRVINIEEILNGYEYYYGDSGPFMLIQPKVDEVETVYNILKENEFHYKVYTKENIPSHYHYSDNELITDIILIADKGWYLAYQKDIDNWKDGATHGYDNNLTDMHGIFIASGPSFKKNYKTGTVLNIDIYPLLCEIYGIQPNKNIDGKLERISFLLAE